MRASRWVIQLVADYADAGGYPHIIYFLIYSKNPPNLRESVTNRDLILPYLSLVNEYCTICASVCSISGLSYC